MASPESAEFHDRCFGKLGRGYPAARIQRIPPPGIPPKLHRLRHQGPRGPGDRDLGDYQGVLGQGIKHHKTLNDYAHLRITLD